jgi:hypothetical protein
MSMVDQIGGAIAKADGASFEVILDLDTTDDGLDLCDQASSGVGFPINALIRRSA